MKPARRQAGISLIAALVAICLAAAPATAVKKTSTKLKTRLAVASTTADGQLVTATATCPKGHKAVGGGFNSGVAAIPGPTISDLFVVYESRRAGPRSWVVSGGREDAGFPGPQLDLTASVNCFKKPGKITEATSAGGLATAAGASTKTARCRRKKKSAVASLTAPPFVAFSGGFSTDPPSLAGPPSVVLVYESYPSALESWTASATAGTGTTVPTVRSYVLCAAVKAPILKTATIALTPGAVLPLGLAQTAPCGGQLRPVGGGFQTIVGTMGPPIVTESQRQGNSWRTASINAIPDSVSLTSYAACLKRSDYFR